LAAHEYFSTITADIQRLHTLLAGIAADSVVSNAELSGLSAWLAEHSHLKNSYPYDEVSNKIAKVLKDNHIDFCGGLPEAVQRAQHYLKKLGHPLKIEVEARSLADVDDALATPGIDVLMLDNFTPDACRAAVERIAGRLQTEASGGITAETLRAYAETGVDFISLGALTHSVKSLDLNFKADVA
jgi:hypothetical protein